MTKHSTPKRYHPVIRVFVSSTFSDLVHERNALQDRVWPDLERYCLLRGFQFQAIDLRWGVPTEAGLDHRTMRICFDELHRAQAVSPRPNFLILLGDRYGWQPLPEEIAPDEFNALKDAASANPDHLRILNDWYRLDTNARPAMHLLRSRRESPDGRDYTQDAKGRDTAAWIGVQNTLWSLINRVYPPEKLTGRFAEPVSPEHPVPPIVRFQGSATEQEIWHGAFAVADARRHVIAFSRNIHNLDTAASKPRLRDFVNVDEHGRLDDNLHGAIRALKDKLKNELGDNYLEAPRPAALWPADDADGAPALEISTDHLDFLCKQIRDRLLPIIEQQIAEYNRVPEPAAGVALSGETLRDLQREREHHARFAAERAPVGVFVGRQAEKAGIIAYLDSDGDRPFVLHGVSGSGKSALMAAAAREAAAGSGALVIERYLGTTKRSSDLRSLLIDLCLSLREHFPLSEELPTDIRLLEKEYYGQLENATAERPIYVFLDALDQLDPADDAHALWWIRSTPLPPHARLVVSCLSDSEDETASGPWNALNQRGFPRPANSVSIEHLELDEAKLLWNRWLEQADRNLTDEQQAAVDERILQGSAACRQPLYLKILFDEARRWPSFAVPPPLGATVPELLASLFDRLSRPEAHGPLFEPALGYLISSRYGLAESELLEILYRDPDYKRQLLTSAQHALPRHAIRIPIAIWSRLRYDLAPYLTERGAPGGSVLHFYHRQVGACVRERFSGTPARRYQWHRRLALYFARQHWWLESRARQRERAQPPYSARPAHVRKITELPDLLLALAREAQAADMETATEEALQWIERLLQKLHFLEAKNEAGRVFELTGDFSRALDMLPGDRPQRRIVQLLDEALRRDIHFIARHADDYPQALFQCMWNNGWWYDCDEAGAHYENGKVPGLTAPVCKPMICGKCEPQNAQGVQRLSNLLECWRRQKNHLASGFNWLRSHRPPPTHLGTALLAVLCGHQDAVSSVSYSPDGRHIISGSWDGTVRAWDARTGSILTVLHGHEGHVNSVVFSPDGARLASGSQDKTVRLWDAASWMELAVLRGHESFVLSVSYSPDGRRLISCAPDETVRVWDARTGGELAVLRGHQGGVVTVACSPDGARIASGSTDKTIRVWDARTGSILTVLHGHERSVYSVAFSPDGARLASGSQDKTVRLWDAASWAELAVLRGHERSVYSVAFSPDGRRTISSSYDRTVRVWDVRTGAEHAVLRGHQGGVFSISCSPDGLRIVSGGAEDHTVRVWDAQSEADSATLQGQRDDDCRIQIVSFSPDGHRIVSNGPEDHTVRVWDVHSGICLAVLQGHDGFIKSVSFTRDGRRIVSSSNDNTARVWDTITCAELAVLRGHQGWIESIAFSPDGRCVATGSNDMTVRVWNIRTGTEVVLLRGHKHWVASVSYSPDNRNIVSGSWDGTIRIWDARSGVELTVLRGHQNVVGSVVYSPDGRCIVSGSSDTTVRVWDARTGGELAVLRGHQGGVNNVAYSRDGRYIVSGSDETIRVWDVGTGQSVEAIGGRGDVYATAAGLPWRALARDQDTVIEKADSGAVVARFPHSFQHIDTFPSGRNISTHPSGRTWAGSVANHLYIITLEGDGKAGESPGISGKGSVKEMISSPSIVVDDVVGNG